jgi:TadE-like protein
MKKHRGVSTIELLIALPVLLLMGLLVLQWALVFHTRSVLQYSLMEAARAGVVANAQLAAIEMGFARGLLVLLPAAHPVQVAAPSQAVATAQLNGLQLEAAEISGRFLAAQKASGDFLISILSPTRASFLDWGEAARNDQGEWVAGATQIPFDNLNAKNADGSIGKYPKSGSNQQRGGYPIGSASGQTLRDANVLKLELKYGISLVVPLVGPALATLATQFLGCPSLTINDCFVYRVTNADGNHQYKLRTLLYSHSRMQSAPYQF